MSDLVGVVLAAGAGTRLRPLTSVRPKALCPVGDRTLLDRALGRVAMYARRTAVNTHHHASQVIAALDGWDVRVSHERTEALGTAGALGLLRDWLDGSPVLLTNADACYPGIDPVPDLVAGWDGERPRLLCVQGGDPGVLGGLRYVGSALLPWWSVRDLAAEPSGLYEVSWRGLYDSGRLDLATTSAEAIDCGTPADYLRANLAVTGGESVVEDGATVGGEVVRSVVWSGERVERGERLVEAVRGAGVTLRPFHGHGAGHGRR
jgi:dTDP-glucose pyrophosphorylase